MCVFDSIEDVPSLIIQVEATEVFFAVTKLFQSKDIGLRRMVYLMIKELSPSADEVNQAYISFHLL